MSTSVLLLALGCLALEGATAAAQTRLTVEIRGRQQGLLVYGAPSGEPVILSSGDGGWIHLAPHVAEFLSSRGFYVFGFDAKAYLAGFTSSRAMLRAQDEPGDYHVLTQLARTTTGKRPLLIGVSEGAGLSVLAVTDSATKADVSGVIGLGLPDLNELGWRWRDALIYLTHRSPNEPTFSAAAIVGRVAPVPIAVIHSTHDEFVPASEIARVVASAREPKRLWVVEAADHRFSDNLAGLDQQLLEAIRWVRAHGPG